jgi:3-polyprenyl-4-hydroxybenzoate decarboxylase
VIWALSTRSDPATDIDILRQTWTNSLDPMLADEDKEQHRLWNSRGIINACKPYARLQTLLSGRGGLTGVGVGDQGKMVTPVQVMSFFAGHHFT